MAGPIVFCARSVHTIASDRIYRVDVRHGAVYFLRIGGQFNLERATEIDESTALAAVPLAVGELLFRRHWREELLARDPSADPEELLAIHPHNFKLSPADVEHALLLPPRWYAILRRHFGRLVLTLADGAKWHFHFERLQDMQLAFAHLGGVLGTRLETEVAWDEKKKRFVRAPRGPMPHTRHVEGSEGQHRHPGGSAYGGE